MPVIKLNKDTFLVQTSNYRSLITVLALGIYLLVAWSHARWWVLLIVGTIFLFNIITNKSFLTRTTISRALAKVTYSQWTIFGPKSISVPFEEIISVKLSELSTGKFNLIIESYNHYIEAASNYTGVEIFDIASTLEEWLELNEGKPIPYQVQVDTELVTLLMGLIRQVPDAPSIYHKGELAWTDLSRFIDIPMGEQTLLFIETEKNGSKGLLFGAFGLYWKNNYLVTPTRQNWIAWQELTSAQIEKDPVDHDLWLGHGLQIGLRSAAQQQLTYKLLSAIQDRINKNSRTK